MRRPLQIVPLLVGLGTAIAVVAGARALHARLVPETPIDERWVNTVAIAVVGVAFLRSLALRPRVRLSPAVATTSGAALAVLAVAVWGNLGTVQLPYHRWDQFHYFIGAKYFPELGYRALYECTAVAEAERFGRAHVAGRAIRDLTTDALVPATTALDAPASCRARFSPERWRAFADDVAWFVRDCPSADYWARMQADHGFNPPPPWTVAGWTLASLAPARARTQTLLGALDPLLLAVAFGLVAWAFGPHVLVTALVVWGCNFPGKGVWTIGGFLRQDWFCAMVTSVCLARRGYWRGSGVALATAAALRIFPALLLALPLAVAGRHWRRHGRVAPSHRRFVVGMLLGGGFWFATSTALFGWGAWTAFAQHMALHRAAPLANDVGLRALLSQTVDGRLARTEEPDAVDPFATWKRVRKDAFAARRPLYLALVGGAAVGLWVASGRVRRLWSALALSIVAVALLVDLASYYWTAVVLLALLAATGRGAERLALGAVLLQRVVNAWPWLEANPDIRYLLQSAVLVPWTALAVVTVVWPRRLRQG